MAVFHIIFVSTATTRLPELALFELLYVTRARNERRGLTGLLLYSDERFMEVLEGPESDVREVFESILRDPRHKNVDLLRFEWLEQCHFLDWRMGFRTLHGAVDDIEGFSRFLEPDFDISAIKNSPIEAYRMLLAFRDDHAP